MKLAPKRLKSSKWGEHRFLKLIVLFCVSFIVGYTIINTYLNYKLGVEISPTLTTCAYAFFGTELCLCAVNRVAENKNKNKEGE